MASESTAAPVHSQSYAYRLVFDKSPCPLEYKQKNLEEAPKKLFLVLAEWKELYRPLPVPSDAKSTSENYLWTVASFVPCDFLSCWLGGRWGVS